MSALRRTLAVVAALLAGTSLIGPAQADPADAWAWWYSARMSQLPALAPPPPSVPEDGLYVASSPSGASAISAVRARVDAEASSVSLVLRLADVVGTPILGACLTTDSWEQVAAGNWDERPEPDCAAGAAPGTLSANASTVTFAVTSLVRDGELNLLIVPGLDESGVSSSFSTAFAAPDDSTLRFTVPAGNAEPDPVPMSDGASFSPPPPAAPLADFTPVPGLTPGAIPDTAVDVPPIAVADSVTDPPVTRAQFDVAADDGGSVAGALVAAALFAVVLVLKERADAGRPPFGALSLAAGSGDDDSTGMVAGIGRFSGPRRGVPPSLS